MKISNRREFLKTSTAACAGITASALIPRRIFGENSEGVNLAYRELGSTGYQATEIGFGAMNTRDSELIEAAIDAGINYIDTAHGYMRGENERIVGKIMKTKRDKVFLTTKLGSWAQPNELESMMETSLERLQTDHVDLVLLHSVSSREPVLRDQYRQIFETIRKKGQTRFVGISTHSNQSEVLDTVVESKFWEAALVGYNYFSPKGVTESIKKAREAGIAIIGMKNLLNPQTNPWSELDDIRTEKSGKMTKAQALIKWALDNPSVDTTVPGMTSFEHLKEDLAIMGMTLTFDDRRDLQRYGMETNEHYCRGVSGCTGCLNQCPFGVEVSQINRCLGYANGYGNMELARENYDRLPSTSRIDICAGCDECTVPCVNGLNLTENIESARRLFA